MRIRLTQIDGKLPNVALMKLSHWHKTRGDEVVFTRRCNRDPTEGAYDRVYGSTIFTASLPAMDRFLTEWPDAIVSGTGVDPETGWWSVEQIIGTPKWGYENYDYGIYPEFHNSIGFSQRGCRLACKFCGVPTKEGKPVSVNRIEQIWRGDGFPKNIHLLDNDFFGQNEWRERLAEISDGGYRVCFNQGINVRALDERVAPGVARAMGEALVTKNGNQIRYLYRDDQFSKPRLYTAWDNLKDENVFFRGVEALEKAGISPKHIMAYMLIGFDANETMERIEYRFNRMVSIGILPYPMVYDLSRRDLKAFQRWAVTGMYRAGIPFADYDPLRKKSRDR